MSPFCCLAYLLGLYLRCQASHDQRYNQAAQGDEKLVEPLYADLEKLVAQEGATALSLVYLGSTRTLMGRDAFYRGRKCVIAKRACHNRERPFFIK